MTREKQIKEAVKSLYESPYFNAGFIEGAKWADAHPHWISVEDELPKDYEWVLCYNDIEREYEVLMYYDRCWWTCEGRFVTPNITTHWMPLPQAPKEGRRL